jgi:hypothetical protein
MTEIYLSPSEVNLYPNYTMTSRMTGEGGNDMAATEAVIGGESLESGSFASRWKVEQNDNNRMEAVGCSTTKSEPDWNFHPLDGGLPVDDAGQAIWNISSSVTINATAMNGPNCVEGNWTGFALITGGENLQNTPPDVCFATNPYGIPSYPGPDVAESYPGLINITPARPEAPYHFFCYATDENGIGIDANGDPVFDLEDLLPAPGFETYPYGYCPGGPGWDGFHLRRVYVGKVNVRGYEQAQDIETGGTPLYDETFIYSTLDGIANGEGVLFPPIVSRDASGIVVPDYMCLSDNEESTLPFGPNPEDRPLNNSDGSVAMTMAFQPILCLDGLTLAQDATGIFEVRLPVWFQKQGEGGLPEQFEWLINQGE